MHSKLRIAALALVLLPTRAVLAADSFDSAAPAKTISPFIDERTIAILHVDAARLDVAPAFDFAATLAPDMRDELDQAQIAARGALDQFRKAGGREMFVMVSLADVPESPPFVVVPIPDGAAEDALREALEIVPFGSHRTLRGTLVLGAKATLDRLESQRPAARPEVARAFEAAGDAAVQALFLPTADARRVIEELVPMLPAEFGGGSTKTLTRGAIWSVLGLKTNPQPSASLVFQSQNHEAAAALRQRWLGFYKFLAANRQVAATLPEFDQIAALLAPQVRGDKLFLTVDSPNQAAELLRAALGPSLKAARMAAQRSKSIENLKQIAIAMHVYHDAHEHLPPAFNSGADGKPLLSWRVLLLPHLDQEPLYREFHLDEPWDSEHNLALVERMPDVYRSPFSKLKTPGARCCLAPAEGTILGGEAVALKNISDGTSNTILFVEADDDRAVIWSQPDDLTLDLDHPQAGLGELLGGQFLTAFADGSVQTLHVGTDAETLRRLFLRADGKPVDWKSVKR